MQLYRTGHEEGWWGTHTDIQSPQDPVSENFEDRRIDF
jgi:hypothetical protein